MAYDRNLDQSLFSKTWDTETSRMIISVHSYNNGPKKLQITRQIKDSDGEFKFAKLGRLSKEEIEAILPLIQEAITALD